MSDKDRSNLASAIAAAEKSPTDDAAWDNVESIAAKLDSPDDVAAAYVRALGDKMSAEAAEALGQRAARFHDEWYGQDASGNLAQLLGRVLELAPRSDWAFQRLTVALTVSERWVDLLALYDRALSHTSEKARQEKLLDEAYQVAKDLAGKPAEAIAYLRRLYGLTRDVKQARELERLLERHDNFKELVQFLEQRIEHVAPAERPQVRLRIARTWFENLNDAGKALDTARLLLAERGRETAEPGASELLERLRAMVGLLDLVEGVNEDLEQHRSLAPPEAVDLGPLRVTGRTH
ncbi:MAG TPA: hypothetical protein VMZ28_06755, partial [Kofleriaceae bacterium]|nr:hypothetical protein [Kofleriaceae bacterium]